MKLDMGKAWNDASAMITGNISLLVAVAGVFLLLPNLALSLLFPEMAQINMEAGSDPQAMLDALSAVYAENWWVFLLLGIVQAVGTLALLALLGDPGKPTVGEALERGAKGFLSYIAAQILVAFGMVIIIGIPIALAFSLSPLFGGLLVIPGIVLMIYAMVKFSLTSPVIVVEAVANPIAALKRSWALTKGNSLRIFAFFALLIIAIFVVSLVVTMVFGVIFAAIGGAAMTIGSAVLGALINAVFTTIVLAALASVHRQLALGQSSGPSASDQG